MTKTSLQIRFNKFLCEIDLVDSISGITIATFCNEFDELVQCQFNIYEDLNPDNNGILLYWDYSTEQVEEKRYKYDPYSNGLEYLEDDIINYLYSEKAIWENLGTF